MPLTIEERIIPLSRIRPGSIARINYVKKDGSGGDYLIMVIDPFRRNQRAKETQLHGYLINEMTESEFINFIVSLNCPIALDPTNAEITLVDLSATEAYNAINTISTYTSRPYRTFNMSGITSVMELVINLPGEFDQIIDSTVLIMDRNSKRRVLQALYDGDITTLKTIPEISRSIIEGRTQETTETVEKSERGFNQTRAFISLRQMFNSVVRTFKGK